MLTAALGLAGPASASVAAPVITSPTSESDFGAEVSVEATSDAPYVLFRLSRHGYAPYVDAAPVPVEGGTASVTLPTAGLPVKLTVSAVNCASSDLASCTGESSAIEAVRENELSLAFEPPSSSSPASRLVDPSRGTFDIGVVGDNLGGTHQLRWSFLTAPGSPAVATSPVSVGANQVDVGGLPDSDYVVDIFRCSAVNPLVCVRAESGSRRSVWVRRSFDFDYLFWDVTHTGGGEEGFISPNGDGFMDATVMSFDVDARMAPTEVTWRLRASDGTTVMGPVTEQVSDNHATMIDPLATLGHPLPAGTYTLAADASTTVDGYEFGASLSRKVLVETLPRLDLARPRFATFNPIRDGYRDVQTFGVHTSNQRYSTKLEILNADSKVVWQQTNDYGIDRSPLGWTGFRTNDPNRPYPEGIYRARITMSNGGETKTRVIGPFRLSHKRLVWEKFARTVTAQGSLHRNRSGSCGALRMPGGPGRAGSIGYASNGRCRAGGPAGTALGHHRLVLPAGVRYEDLELWFRGGSRSRSYGLGASVGVIRPDGTFGAASVAGAGYNEAYYGFRATNRHVRSYRSIHWYVRTRNGMYYVIDSFRIEGMRQVLR